MRATSKELSKTRIDPTYPPMKSPKIPAREGSISPEQLKYSGEKVKTHNSIMPIIPKNMEREHSIIFNIFIIFVPFSRVTMSHSLLQIVNRELLFESTLSKNISSIFNERSI